MAFRRAFGTYTNFFENHLDKIVAASIVGGSAIGTKVAYDRVNPRAPSDYAKVFLGSITGGVGGLVVSFILEPIIIPCSTVYGLVCLYENINLQ